MCLIHSSRGSLFFLILHFRFVWLFLLQSSSIRIGWNLFVLKGCLVRHWLCKPLSLRVGGGRTHQTNTGSFLANKHVPNSLQVETNFVPVGLKPGTLRCERPKHAMSRHLILPLLHGVPLSQYNLINSLQQTITISVIGKLILYKFVCKLLHSSITNINKCVYIHFSYKASSYFWYRMTLQFQGFYLTVFVQLEPCKCVTQTCCLYYFSSFILPLTWTGMFWALWKTYYIASETSFYTS